MIYRVETPAGMLPYEFKTERAAKDYALGVLSWSGTRYRIHRMRSERAGA